MEQVLEKEKQSFRLSSSILLERFIESFVDNIKKSKKENLEMLKLYGERKNFLKYNLFPEVAKDLNLNYKSNEEFLRVDYTFFYNETQNKWKVPAILIESENNFNSSYEEVLKLLSINAPLKLLVLYDLSAEDLDKYIAQDECDWDYMIKDFNEATANIGYFGVIVINSNNLDNLSIITKIYDTHNNKIEKAKKIEITNLV